MYLNLNFYKVKKMTELPEAEYEDPDLNFSQSVISFYFKVSLLLWECSSK